MLGRKEGYIRSLGVLLGFVALISAHGIGYTLLENRNVQYVQFYYTTGHEVAYASVQVFDPFDGELEFQNGRSDRHGGFAFLPDTSGGWYVRIADAQGHETTAELLIEFDTELDEYRGKVLSEHIFE